MKNLVTTILFIAFTFFTAKGQETYKVNIEVSSIEWIGKKVTGQHEGVVRLSKGSYTVEDGLITKGELLINMQSISITDIEDQEQNDKLQGHLISNDFFSVKKHPTAKLIILASESIGENKLKVKANLTIKGISKRIEFTVTMLKEGNKMVAIGEVDIDRTEFNIQYGSGSFFDNLGDKAIKDLFTIKFKVAALQQ